eukprot:scaffold29203_cov67-Phaeocystis_antarctica.AAC.2
MPTIASCRSGSASRVRLGAPHANCRPGSCFRTVPSTKLISGILSKTWLLESSVVEYFTVTICPGSGSSPLPDLTLFSSRPPGVVSYAAGGSVSKATMPPIRCTRFTGRTGLATASDSAKDTADEARRASAIWCGAVRALSRHFAAGG